MEKLKEIIKTHIPKDIEMLSLKIDSRSSSIKIIVDSVKDIPIDKTADLVKEIKNDENIISSFPDGVRLEVGTPGIGSNLEKAFQYKKNIGRKIQLEYQLNSNTISNTYLLSDANEIGIVVDDGIGKLGIDYNNIINARIKISFD
ncbi:MAG: hypothetical protein CMG41_06015 [Candidatus Marinimicrobia bacterium]|nr:hypothetical protein [Candidatus Neomarinimicrobiota bacterium]